MKVKRGQWWQIWRPVEDGSPARKRYAISLVIMFGIVVTYWVGASLPSEFYLWTAMVFGFIGLRSIAKP